MDKHVKLSRQLRALFPDRTGMQSPSGRQGNVRPVVLIVIAFVMGAAVSAFWFYRASRRDVGTINAPGQETTKLSPSTLAVLNRLESPVEIRFYSLLTPGSVPASEREFAGRVDQLLAEFERQAEGRIRLSRHKVQSDAASDAASKDGIRPFHLDKGDACFLGIAVSHKEQRESLAQLSPDWEQALEPDLARVIERVAFSRMTTPGPAVPAFDAASTEAVRRALPNLANVSLEEGKRILRQRAVTEFAASVREMETQVKEAQQRLSAVQQDGSETEQQAAMQQLQQLQTAHSEKLKAIAARSQAQIAALEALKRQ
jgi:hypothetical protein